MQQTLDDFRNDRLDAAALATTWRRSAADWPGLPPRYLAVLETLLASLVWCCLQCGTQENRWICRLG